MSHHIQHLSVKDIDGSIIWHYTECSCGWESAKMRDQQLTIDEAIEHERSKMTHAQREACDQLEDDLEDIEGSK